MKLSEIVAALQMWAPLELAEAWDNVGLLAGDPASDVKRLALCVDLTSSVLDEVMAAGCDLVVAYHPPIFAPLKRIDAKSPVGRALRAGIALYSPHTALDVADGGTNDVLADVVGMGVRAPLRPFAAKDVDYKLVVFVPAEAVAKVSQAIFAAGAGRIGRYSSCSFRTRGTGTFFGEEGTSPVVGERGRHEEVNEERLETVVPIGAVDAVVSALRASHPYEEPAFDLVRLAAAPRREGLGLGRIGDLAKKTPRSDILARIEKELGLSGLLVAGPRDGEVKRVAVAAGSCGDLYRDALRGGAELYLTGEMRHHEAREALEGGTMSIVATLHSNSERATLRRLGERLSSHAPGVAIVYPASDRDPFEIA